MLRMKNFNILGVHWKIRLLGGVTKNQYRAGDCQKKKGGLEQFANLRGGGLGKKEGWWCFWGGSWYPNAHYDRIIQLNCGEVHFHASYKTTRTWENFSNRGTKMILPSEKLGSIANNSKIFGNGSKSIIRNNIGLYKRSYI